MAALAYTFNYIWHRLRSNSRHGTHSPFVYRLVDEVVYNYHAEVPERVTGYRPQKVNDLLNRLIHNWLMDDTGDREYVLIGPHSDQAEVFEHLLPNTHSGTLLIFQGIYQNKTNRAAWRIIAAHPEVRVSIDLFYIGLVFFREGQRKENFRIRF